VKGNFDEMSMQDAMRLANSRTGQQLLSMMKNSDPKMLEKAASQAASGDYEQLKQTMSAFLSNPEMRALLEQLGRQKNG
jgi:uncharacterized protein with von Willebrand factor type A (vWA) domain